MIALAVITGTIWLGVSYGSPCAPLPPALRQAALYPEPLPSSIIMFSSYQTFPQLWCRPGQYSVFGQACPGLPCYRDSHVPCPASTSCWKRQGRHQIWRSTMTGPTWLQVFLRPPRLMLRNLINLSMESASGGPGVLLDVPVTALYCTMTFAM